MAQAERSAHNTPIIAVKGIRKSFGQNAVLKGIDLSVYPGEVVALIGGNGAGKSTLMKIIMGIYHQDTGIVEVNGEKADMSKTGSALSRGIYMVPQEPMLFPNMTVKENILIGFNKPETELTKELTEIMEEVGWKLALDRKASSLSIAEQQMVEILRGLLRHAQMLILDEPTSALTFDEVESLFRVVQDLKQKKIGIIYITHRLAEVFEIGTDVAILRDGVVTLSGPISDFNREMLIKGLLPPGVENSSTAEEVDALEIDYTAAPVLELQDYSGYGFSHVNMKLWPGEVLGVAGVVGAGRTEMATTIFGMDKVLGGKVILDGVDITGLKTKKVIAAGLNYVPEDRHLNGLFKIANVAANTSSALLNYGALGKAFLNTQAEEKVTQQYIDLFRTKVTGQEQLTGSLSGGNQQKVVIGRSLSTSPKVVILDEPTRGIDAAARGDVYASIRKLRDQGVSVVLISSDIEEIVELADRAVTIYQGRLNAEFQKADINQDNLMAAAFGVVAQKEV